MQGTLPVLCAGDLSDCLYTFSPDDWAVLELFRLIDCKDMHARGLRNMAEFRLNHWPMLSAACSCGMLKQANAFTHLKATRQKS